MKKNICWILLILEVCGIFLIGFLPAIIDAMHCGAVIQTPEGMKLTINHDISITEDGLTIQLFEGTAIYPSTIYPNEIKFFYDVAKNKSIVPKDALSNEAHNDNKQNIVYAHVAWDSINEKDQLIGLKNAADQKQRNDQKRYLLKGAIIGGTACFCWLIVGALLNFLLKKKEKTKLLHIIHSSILVIILAIFWYKGFFLYH